MLAEILKSTIDTSINEFYSKKESERARKKHYTIKESSSELQVSTLTVRNYIDRGLLTAFKIGNRVLITNESLESALTEVKSLKYKR